MIWKILLTAAVIAGAVMVIKRRRLMAELEQSGGAVPAAATSRPLIKALAVGVVVLFILGSGFFLYAEWQDNYRVVSVHVIDTRSGKEVTYEAYKGDIQTRSFITVGGRQVNLAEVERMELSD